MKRSDAVSKLKTIVNNLLPTFDITTHAAETILTELEKMGMKPPAPDVETCQAILSVYMWSDFNQWDEEIEKDAKVMEAKRKRAEWAAERAAKAASKKESK